MCARSTTSEAGSSSHGCGQFAVLYRPSFPTFIAIPPKVSHHIHHDTHTHPPSTHSSSKHVAMVYMVLAWPYHTMGGRWRSRSRAHAHTLSFSCHTHRIINFFWFMPYALKGGADPKLRKSEWMGVDGWCCAPSSVVIPASAGWLPRS